MNKSVNNECIMHTSYGSFVCSGAPSIPGRILEAPEHPEVVHILTRISTSGGACQILKPGNFKVGTIGNFKVGSDNCHY